MSPVATTTPTVAQTRVLRDGGLAEIRELTTDDKDAVSEVVQGLSPGPGTSASSGPCP